MSKWETVKLGDICTIVTGGTPSTSVKSYWDNGKIPWLPSGICQNAIIDKSDTFITKEGLNNSSAKIMPINTVVIALTGTTTGKVGILKIEACANQSVTGILPNDTLHYKYIFYYLLFSRSKIMNDSYGGAQKHISQRYVKDFQIPLPPLEIQKKIVLTLDKVTHIIDLCNTILEKMELLVKARFAEMFGDPVSNPMRWQTKLLLSIGKCKNGMNFHYDDNGVEINCLGVGDFKDLSIITDTSALPKISLNEMPTDEYLLKNNDIVFVRSNGNKALVGRSLAVYPDDIPTTFSGFCIRFRKDDDSILIPYLLRVLKTDSIRKKMAGRGANIQNLNQQILSTLEIPVPPLELQQKFADFIKQTEKSKSAVKKVLEKAETLKKALMQEYFG